MEEYRDAWMDGGKEGECGSDVLICFRRGGGACAEVMV